MLRDDFSERINRVIRGFAVHLTSVARKSVAELGCLNPYEKLTDGPCRTRDAHGFFSFLFLYKFVWKEIHTIKLQLLSATLKKNISQRKYWFLVTRYWAEPDVEAPPSQNRQLIHHLNAYRLYTTLITKITTHSSYIAYTIFLQSIWLFRCTPRNLF